MDKHFDFDAYVLDVRAVDKKQILQNLSWKIGRQTSADMTWICDQLLLAEEKETSGIGDGVAIPHLKSTPLRQPFVLVARLDQPVDFNALDGQNVDIVCIVLSPQMDGPVHLQRLARVTRVFRDPRILEGLRKAASEEEMEIILRSEQAPHRERLAA